jgi:hypothetical protein
MAAAGGVWTSAVSMPSIRVSTGCAMDQADGGPSLASQVHCTMEFADRNGRRRLWPARMTISSLLLFWLLESHITFFF